MIDPFDCNLIPLRAAALRCPPGRTGKPRHVSTLHRWALRGVRGVRLATVCIGGVRYTTPEALREFFSAISAQKPSAPQGHAPNQDDPAERERRAAVARARAAVHGLRPSTPRGKEGGTYDPQ